MEADVKVQMLGAFSLHVAGQEVKLRLAKARSLLAYLAMNPQSHSRETLAALFWPDLDPSAAMLSLRQVIHHLRAAISTGAGDNAFQVDRQSVRLASPGRCWVDVWAFRALLERGDLEQAAQLYRGEFLADVPVGSELFHDWLEMTRRTLHNQMLTVLSQLIEQRMTADDPAGAQRWAEERMLLDPLDEWTHRGLMKIHLAEGQRHKALAQFERLSRLLKEELGVGPAPETVNLYNRILSGGGGSGALPVIPESGLSALQKQKLTYFFRLADHDNDGFIRDHEFQRRGEAMCRRIGLDRRSGVGQELCEGFVTFWNGFGQLLGVDAAEPLTLEQWLIHWSRWNGIVTDQAARRELSEVRYRKDLTLIWFGAIDLDEDGLIDAHEYSHWLLTWSDRIDASATFRHLDTDGDGRLSREDVLAIASEFFLSSDPEARGNYFFGDPFA